MNPPDLFRRLSVMLDGAGIPHIDRWVKQLELTQQWEQARQIAALE